VLFLDIDRFHFKSIGFDSDILQRAFERCYPLLLTQASALFTSSRKDLFSLPMMTAWLDRLSCRYESIIFDTPAYVPRSHSVKEKAELADKGIHRLKVYVSSSDQSLNLQTDESYALTVAAPTSTLEVRTSHHCAVKGKNPKLGFLTALTEIF